MKRRERRRLRKIIIVALLPVSVVLMLLPPAFTRPGRQVMLEVAGPVELALTKVFDTLAEIPARFRASGDLLQKNSDLTVEVETLRSELAHQDAEHIRELKRLAQRAQLSGVPGLKERYRFLPTDIISKHMVRGVSGVVARSFKLGIGGADGVQRDDLVVVGWTVVGKVTTVSRTVSEVKLLTHVDCRIHARTTRGGVEGVLKGDGATRCLLMDFKDARATFAHADYVVTSGVRGLHPPGLLLGTIENADDTSVGGEPRVVVKPVARFDRLSQVFVVRRRDDLR